VTGAVSPFWPLALKDYSALGLVALRKLNPQIACPLFAPRNRKSVFVRVLLRHLFCRGYLYSSVFFRGMWALDRGGVGPLLNFGRQASFKRFVMGDPANSLPALRAQKP
jgi:hypothetical protein